MSDISRGQRSKECDITGCNNKGRILAKLGDIPIGYCPYHRKRYGERIINALINSLFNYKLSNFLSNVKADIFMNKDFLCQGCSEKLKQYIINKTEKLDGIIEFQEKNDAKFDEEKLQ